MPLHTTLYSVVYLLVKQNFETLTLKATRKASKAHANYMDRVHIFIVMLLRVMR